jgi:hypothetical protein
LFKFKSHNYILTDFGLGSVEKSGIVKHLEIWSNKEAEEVWESALSSPDTKFEKQLEGNV